MAFTSLNPFRVNRRLLPDGLAEIRLITMIAVIVTLAQWIIPVGARYAFNGGRIYYSNDTFALWDPLLPWPVLDVPAWLTISTGVIAITGATVYFLRGGMHIAGDIFYLLIVMLLACGYVPWYIAMLNMDPSGVIHTPGDDGYPMGWHWVISPLCVIPFIAAIIAALRVTRLRTERTRIRAERRARSIAQLRAERGDGSAGEA